MIVTIKNNSVTLDMRDGVYLASYNTIVAYQGPKGNLLYPNWDCSKTTLKHVSRFFGLPIKEIRKKLKTGENGFRYEEYEPDWT